MKKMMTAIAACAVASLSLAAGGVTSQNTVGYASRTAKASGWTLLGINWEKVGGGDLAFDTLIGANPNLADTDAIQIYDPVLPAVTYTYYGGIWYDGVFNEVHPVIKAGSAVWFFRSDTTPIVLNMSGQVGKASVVNTFPKAAWSQFSASVAVEFNPANTALVTWDGLVDTCAIQTYISPSESTTYTCYSGVWYDGVFNEINSGIIAIGEGAWFFNASGSTDVTLTQNSPL